MPKVDRRLVGTWKSDRRRTFREFAPPRGASREGLRKLKALFGKLVIRWGYRRCITALEGFKDSASYEVIDRDSDSVMIRYYDRAREKDRLRQIHFEGDHYWTWVAGNLREYFKRVPVRP